ncbi:DnaJ domain-containing protein, partial [Haloferax sp. BAB-2207]
DGPSVRPPRRGMSRQQALDTLDLDGDASADDVKAAYRERVKETHPDSKTGDEEAFKRVNRAYERLTD